MNTMKSNFSENLKRLRLLSGETQSELGESVNVAKTTINMYEKGKRLPSLETVKDLAAHLGVSVDYLVRYIDVSKTDSSEKKDDEPDSDANPLSKFDIYFPLLIDETSLTNRNYEKAVTLAKKFHEQFQNNEPLDSKELMDCYDLFGIAFTEKQYYSAIGYVWAFYIMWLKRFSDYYDLIDKEKRNRYQLLSDFYREKSVKYFELRKELLELDGGVLLKAISFMRSRSDMRELGDYYYALRYLIDMPDNDLPPDMNAMIGAQLMEDLCTCTNYYAEKLLATTPQIIR